MPQYGVVSDFILSLEIEAMQPNQPCDGVVVIFGYQDESNFYFLNCAGPEVPMETGLFQVNPDGVSKILEQTTVGAVRFKQCHFLKIERQVLTGVLRFYLDDMERPVLTFVDSTFQRGSIGIGLHQNTALKREPEIKAVRAFSLSAD